MYVLRNKFYSILIFLFDLIGTLVANPFKKLLKRHLPKDIKKILVIRLDHIGDVVLTTPLLRALKEKYPAAKLVVLTSRGTSDIVKTNPFVDEIMKYNAPWFERNKKIIKLREFFKLVSQIRKENFDIGLDPRGDLRHILMMWLAGIKYKIGYGITGGGFLLDWEATYNTKAHEVRRNLNLTKGLGFKTKFLKPEFYVSEKEEIRVDEISNINRISENDFTLVIHAGAGYPTRLWRNEKWAEVIERLYNDFHAKIFIIGGHSEKQQCKDILKRSGHKAIDLVGKTRLSESAALIKKAKLFIGTDSGPCYIAYAVGTPEIVLYSHATVKYRWEPLGKKVVTIQKDAYCKLCEKLYCDNNICMDLITVDEVMEAVKQVVRCA